MGGESMSVQSSATYTLAINDEERQELLRILEQYLIDTHAERRRTEGPAYHEQIVHEENLVKALTEKVRLLGR
jgi:hypothetical protein